MNISGWGGYPRLETKVKEPRCENELLEALLDGGAIARGNGRSYGDSAIGTRCTIHMKHFSRILAFDDMTGQLVVEAGVLLGDIVEIFLQKGWFPFVTPGTKFVTIGGMIAADVHGKNHHKEGSVANYIDWIDVVSSDGNILRCSKTENTELFQWTIGGMGLTGVILRAAIRLRPVSSAWIKQKLHIAGNIHEAIDIFEKFSSATYSVAWIDCLQRGAALGRSLVMLGEHANAADVPTNFMENPLHTPAKRKLSVPFNFPGWTLNNFNMKIFNALYFRNGRQKPQHQMVDWDSYFYPLDNIIGWNKIYGRNGFSQFQCVLPLSNAEEGISEILQAIEKSGAAPFFAVLKRLGAQRSKFSFPMEGYTIALDFPVNVRTMELMNVLDQITLRHEGRFYLAKDSRVCRDVYVQSEPRVKNLFRI